MRVNEVWPMKDVGSSVNGEMVIGDDLRGNLLKKIVAWFSREVSNFTYEEIGP